MGFTRCVGCSSRRGKHVLICLICITCHLASAAQDSSLDTGLGYARYTTGTPAGPARRPPTGLDGGSPQPPIVVWTLGRRHGASRRSPRGPETREYEGDGASCTRRILDGATSLLFLAYNPERCTRRVQLTDPVGAQFERGVSYRSLMGGGHLRGAGGKEGAEAFRIPPTTGARRSPIHHGTGAPRRGVMGDKLSSAGCSGGRRRVRRPTPEHAGSLVSEARVWRSEPPRRRGCTVFKRYSLLLWILNRYRFGTLCQSRRIRCVAEVALLPGRVVGESFPPSMHGGTAWRRQSATSSQDSPPSSRLGRRKRREV